MKGHSLWSVLMLAWLSATNAPSLPEEPGLSDISVSDQDSESETGIASEVDVDEAAAVRVGEASGIDSDKRD